jgi:hypothetical protein
MHLRNLTVTLRHAQARLNASIRVASCPLRRYVAERLAVSHVAAARHTYGCRRAKTSHELDGMLRSRRRAA